MSAGKRPVLFSACSLFLLLSACGTQPVYRLGASSAAPLGSGATKVVVVDNRPEGDKEFSVGSFFVGSSDYGMLSLGDKAFSPAPIDALRLSVQQSAATASGRAPQQIEIRVDRLIVNENRKQLFLAQGSRGILLAEVVGEKLSGETIDARQRDPFLIATFQGSASVDGTNQSLSFSRTSKRFNVDSDAARQQAIQATLGDILQAVSAQLTGASNTKQPPFGLRATTPSGSSSASGNAVPHKFGKHSYQIEQMAKGANCSGGSGAYLTTDAGPIESYRIDCESGATYSARCEYGKCTAQ